MSIARTAARRRRQAANNYKHLGPKVRPRYSKMDPAKSARREAQRRAKLQAMAGRKKS